MMSSNTDEQLDKMLRDIANEECITEDKYLSLEEGKRLVDALENQILSQKVQEILKDDITSNRELRKEVNELKKNVEHLKEEFNNLEQRNNKQSTLYDDIMKVIEPYMGDFTGYDEKLGEFNIVLAVKELVEEANSIDKTAWEHSIKL